MSNYTTALTDPRFGRAVVFTVGLTLVVTAILLVLGYLLAVAVNRLHRMRPIVLGLLLLAYVIPGLVGATMFSWLFDSNFGAVRSTTSSPTSQVRTSSGSPARR